MVRQLLIESLVLCGIGGLMGISTAWLLLNLYQAYTPTRFMIDVPFDITIVLFTIAVCVVAAVMVSPAQVTLPFGPITTKPVVTIQNNSTNALTLSEPTVNAKDVEVQINEVQPGRTFVASLKVPEGFEIAHGEKLELSIKSNHPQYPVIKVPITQMQRPAAPAIAPGVQIKGNSPSAALARPFSPPNAVGK